ncbi:hypothetical protein H4Q26_005686 [Puccinia striiformis f. sp. tritici PST-130]|nr:hypothetical protein H4Q26_005686 [Puccinia striiformis f. sp. tritici PST-130]
MDIDRQARQELGNKTGDEDHNLTQEIEFYLLLYRCTQTSSLKRELTPDLFPSPPSPSLDYLIPPPHPPTKKPKLRRRRRSTRLAASIPDINLTKALTLLIDLLWFILIILVSWLLIITNESNYSESDHQSQSIEPSTPLEEDDQEEDDKVLRRTSDYITISRYLRAADIPSSSDHRFFAKEVFRSASFEVHPIE